MAKRMRMVIKNVRCMYPNLDAPKAFEGQTEDQAKYGLKVLLPKDDKGQLSDIKKFIQDAVAGAEGWSSTVKKQVLKVALDQDPYNDNCVVKDGDRVNGRRVDEEKDKVSPYEGHIVIGANRNQKGGAPTVKGPDGNKIPQGLIAGEILSGYWVNIYVEAYLYSKPKQGITLSLLAVQKVKEDEVFGREDPFEAIESDEDDDNIFEEEDAE